MNSNSFFYYWDKNIPTIYKNIFWKYLILKAYLNVLRCSTMHEQVYVFSVLSSVRSQSLALILSNISALGLY